MLEETDDRRSDFLRVIRGDSIVFCWTCVVDILAPSDLVLDREFRGRSDFLRGSSNDDFLESSSVASISSTFSFLILQTELLFMEIVLSVMMEIKLTFVLVLVLSQTLE